MNPTEPTATPQESKPPVKRRRRWLWALLALFALGVLLVALAPTLLSTGPARRFVLGKVSGQINGSVTASSWSFGWFSGVRMTDLKVSDAAGKEMLTVSSISAPAGLLSMARSTKELQTVEVVRPQVELVVDADGQTNFQKLMKPTAQTGTPSSSSSAPSSVSVHERPSAPAPKPLGFDVKGQFKVTDGRVTVRAAGSDQAFEIKGLNVAVGIDGVNNPVTFDVNALLGQANAPLKVTGSAKVMENGVAKPEALDASFTADLTGLQLREFQPLAAQFKALDKLSGSVSAHVQAHAKGADQAQAGGSVKVTALAMGGGLLGKDEPTFDQVTLDFDVAREGANVAIKKFKVDSPVAKMESNGTLSLPKPGELPAGDVKLRTEVNLPALAQRFPNTLRLQQGLTLTGGTLTAESWLSSATGAVRACAVTNVTVTGLAAKRDGREFALEKPISLVAELSQTQAGVSLDRFEFSSSFAQAKGAGNAEKFDLTASSDLAAATAEARKFVDMGKLDASGKLQFEAHMTSPAPQQRALRAVAQVSDLVLTGLGPQPASISKGTLSLDARAMLDAKNAPQSIEGLKIALESPLAIFSMTSDKLTFPQGQSLPVAGKLAIEASAELSQVMATARAAGAAPADLDVAGALAFKGEALLDQGKALLAPAKLTIANLIVTQGTKRMTEPSVELSFALAAAPATRSVKLSDVKFALSSGQVTGSAEVPDWTAPQQATAAFHGQFDVAKLLISLHDFAPLPQGTTVAATASFDLKVTADKGSQKADVTAQLADLKVTSPGKPAVTEKKIELAAAAIFTPAKPNTAGGSCLALDSLKLSSELLAVQAKARIDDLEKSRKLQADGSWTPNFDKIGPLVAALSGQPVELSGNESREFHVKAELGATDISALLRALFAQAGVYIKRLSVMGIETGVMDVPLHFENGVGTMKVDTTVSGGKLLLPLQVDARPKVAVATVPDNTAVLTGVKITDSMADQFLSRVSPLFKGGVVSAGSVGLTLRKTTVPLAPPILTAASLDGEMALNGVRMSASGFLKELASAVKLGQTELLVLPDQKVGFTLRNGVIRQEPLTMILAGYQIKLSGSVGLVDMRLDMLAEVPVTREMLGGRADLYAMVKDQTIKVPISGTTSHPTVSREAMANALAPLIEAAGKQMLKEKGGAILEGLLKKKK